MKNRFRLMGCLIIWSLFSKTDIYAQDLTGIWRGHFRSNDGLERLVETFDGKYKIYDDRYKMEVQIAQTKNHFEAITYSYKNTEFYGKAAATGSLNIETKKVLLKEGKLLEVRFANGFVCLMTCFMQYSKLGNDEYLQGTYYSTSVNDSLAGCGKGSIFLHRVTESDFHKEPFLEKKEQEELSRIKPVVPPVVKKVSPAPAAKPVAKTKKPANTKPLPATSVPLTAKNSTPGKNSAKKQPPAQVASKPVAVQKSSAHMLPEKGPNERDSTLKISQPLIAVKVPNVLRTRTNEVLKTLTVSHSTIEIRIYDDGAIDNDTVSVYYDNKLIISKVRLTDQAITLKIAVEPSDHAHQLVMVAENLGEIPPNTSLLVVRDGEKMYEERIISTEQKNVQLNFIYRKAE